MKYLLDTNICIHFLRGKFEVDKTKSHRAVDIFLKGIVIIPIYDSIKKYAEERVRLNKLGNP